jgi:hypothetical protein
MGPDKIIMAIVAGTKSIAAYLIEDVKTVLRS